MIYKSYILEENTKIFKNFNISLFYGENTGLKKEFKNVIKKIYGKATYLNYFQDEILKNLDSFYSELNNNSLFEEEKIYFINNITDKFYEFFLSIEAKLKSQKIILFADNLEKKSKIRDYFEKSKKLAVIACYQDNEVSLKKHILKKLKGYEGLTNEIMNFILQQTNLDRLSVNNEIEKIQSFNINKRITKQDLEQILDQQSNENFNVLKDKAMNGDKKNTNKLLSDTIFEPEKNVMYLSLINQRLNQLNEFKDIKIQNQEIALSKLKPQIFWKDKSNFMLQTTKWNSNKIKRALKKSYNLEIKIKSDNVIKKELLIKEFIVDLCNTANSL